MEVTAKEYLIQLGELNIKIAHKKQELNVAKKSIGIKGKQSGERVQTSFVGAHGSQTDSQALRVVMIEEEVASKIIEYLEMRNAIIDQIHKLNDSLHIEILYRRYVQEEHHFEKIAFDLGYAYQYIINKHGEALKRFEQMFSNEFKKML